MLTPDEASVMIANLSLCSSIGFVFKSGDGGYWGRGRIDSLSRSGFSVNTSDGRGLAFDWILRGCNSIP